MAAPVCIPTNSVEGALFSTTSPAFIICRLFDDGRSNWCEVIPRCILICISLLISDVEHLSMCLLPRLISVETGYKIVYSGEE